MRQRFLNPASLIIEHGRELDCAFGPESYNHLQHQLSENAHETAIVAIEEMLEPERRGHFRARLIEAENCYKESLSCIEAKTTGFYAITEIMLGSLRRYDDHYPTFHDLLPKNR